MNLWIGCWVELIIMHSPFIQELLPETTNTQLHHVEFFAASMEPPYCQCSNYEKEPYGHAEKNALETKQFIVSIVIIT